MTMKTKVFAIALITIFINACVGEERDIRRNAQKYLDATGEYNIDEACRYCTAETQSGLIAIEQTLIPKLDSTYIEQNTPAHIKITSTKIVNDTTAKVNYHKKTPIDEFDGTLTMKKRNGIWQAHMPANIPPILRQKEHTLNIDSIESKIASGELKFTRIKKN